ncbi:virion structural protein [Cellulophaga phage phi39:1]|uniref:virion structural protein n=1 Tax=Cellulophaga phage phi39:1 TaxID=1327993 RepID=UPI000351A2F6|nr:virion structural protein [Cellulophaga phage phi39:1]AGO49140.1 structural protein [Cellulophaga phage phi39:1]
MRKLILFFGLIFCLEMAAQVEQVEAVVLAKKSTAELNALPSRLKQIGGIYFDVTLDDFVTWNGSNFVDFSGETYIFTGGISESGGTVTLENEYTAAEKSKVSNLPNDQSAVNETTVKFDKNNANTFKIKTADDDAAADVILTINDDDTPGGVEYFDEYVEEISGAVSDGNLTITLGRTNLSDLISAAIPLPSPTGSGSYSAGTGLSLGGSVFSLAPSVQSDIDSKLNKGLTNLGGTLLDVKSDVGFRFQPNEGLSGFLVTPTLTSFLMGTADLSKMTSFSLTADYFRTNLSDAKILAQGDDSMLTYGFVKNYFLTKDAAAALYAPIGSSTGGGDVDDADADPLNEIQTLSVSGNTVTLSKDGGAFVIPSGGINQTIGNSVLTLKGITQGDITTTAKWSLTGSVLTLHYRFVMSGNKTTNGLVTIDGLPYRPEGLTHHAMFITGSTSNSMIGAFTDANYSNGNVLRPFVYLSGGNNPIQLNTGQSLNSGTQILGTVTYIIN